MWPFKFNLQKSKWRDKQINDIVEVHNPVAEDPISDDLQPWIGKKGVVTDISIASCAGDIFTVAFPDGKTESFHSSALWYRGHQKFNS